MSLLVDWLWQGSLLAAAAGLVLRAWSRASAATRHHVWWAALALVVALPCGRIALAPAPAVRGSTGAIEAVTVVVPASPLLFEIAAIALWVGLSAWLLARLARDVVAIRRLRSGSRPFPPLRAGSLPSWNARAASRRPADLRVSDEVAVPCALGLGRATIVVPARLLDTLTDRQLDHVVMHEQAHLERRDDWWQLAQAVVRVAAALHPAVHWICRRIDLEREAACDDLVVARTGDVRSYARCLVDVAEALSLRPGMSSLPGVVPGATRAGRTLHLRVRRLLDARRATHASAPLALGGALVVASALAALLVSSAPAIDFREVLGSVPDVARRLPAIMAPAGQVAAVAANGDATSTAPAPRRPSPAQPRTVAVAPARVDDVVASAAEVSVPAGDAPLPVLVARPVTAPVTAMPSALGGADRAPRGPSPWQRVTNAGTAVGEGARDGGTALGAFFTRSGRRVAGAFTGANP